MPASHAIGEARSLQPPRRALAALGCVVVGLLAGRWWDAPASVWFGAGAALAVAAIAISGSRGGAWRAGALCGACALLAAGWWTHRVETVPADALSRALRDDRPTLVRVEGVVLDAPVQRERRGRFARWSFGAPSWRFRLRVELAFGAGGEVRPASGVLYARSAGGRPDVRTGDRVRVTGMGQAPGAATLPGGYPSDQWARQAGVAGFFETEAALIERVEREASPPLRAWRMIKRLRDAARSRALALLGETDERVRPLLAATLLGEREAGLEPTRRAFTRLGIAHLLAVSGMHLAALAGITLALLRVPAWGWRVRGGSAIAVTLLYMMMVPAKAPILRAGTMTIALLAGEAMGRRHDRLTMLAWAAIAVLLWRPMELLNPGFHLSFGVVAGLIALTPRAHARLLGPAPEPPESSLPALLKHRASQLLAGAFVAWAIATPMVAAHFGVISPLGVLTGLALAPLFGATLGMGFLAIALGLALPETGARLMGVVESLAGAQLWVVERLDGAPGATLRWPPMPALMGLVGALLAAWWLRGERGRRLRTARWAATIAWALGVGGFALHGSRGGLAPGAALRIDTLAVGDGTCHLIRSPWGALLWDAGGANLAAGERDIPRAIRTLGAWRVRDVVVTHPNLDHYAYLPDLVRPLGVRRAHVGRATLDEARRRPDGPEAALLDALEQLGVEVRTLAAGDALRIAGMTIDILSPERDAGFEEINDRSLVALLGVDARPDALLLTGDIQDEAIAALRRRRPDLAPLALEVPHHGSARPTGIEFVEQTPALVAIQSTGPSRARDERWSRVRAGKAWLSTTERGSIAIEWLRDGRMRWGPTTGEAGWTEVWGR